MCVSRRQRPRNDDISFHGSSHSFLSCLLLSVSQDFGQLLMCLSVIQMDKNWDEGMKREQSSMLEKKGMQPQDVHIWSVSLFSFLFCLFFLSLSFSLSLFIIPVLPDKNSLWVHRVIQSLLYMKEWEESLDSSSSSFVSWVECVVFVRDSLCLYSLLSVCESKYRESSLDSHQDVLRVSFVSCSFSLVLFCVFIASLFFLFRCSISFVCFLEYISVSYSDSLYLLVFSSYFWS